MGWDAIALLAEAKQLREDNKLKGALQKYKRAIELYPENFQANKEMKEIEAIEEKRAYIKKIEIKKFQSGEREKIRDWQSGAGSRWQDYQQW